jgi:hypothetical protein
MGSLWCQKTQGSKSCELLCSQMMRAQRLPFTTISERLNRKQGE